MRKIEASIDRVVQKEWLLGESLPGVDFRMNQTVRVVSGPVKGVRGQLISVLRTTPEPAYHLEATDGRDEHVFQSEIKGDLHGD